MGIPPAAHARPEMARARSALGPTGKWARRLEPAPRAPTMQPRARTPRAGQPFPSRDVGSCKAKPQVPGRQRLPRSFTVDSRSVVADLLPALVLGIEHHRLQVV